MKIKKVVANNRRRSFEVEVGGRALDYPYARVGLKAGGRDRIDEVWVDAELGNEAFTFRLSNGKEDSVHIDQVLEYNEDPSYLSDMLLYKLTLEAQEKVAESALSKREIIRRLGTSASQFYRLLDQTNYKKSAGQMLSLLHILGCDVDFVVKKRRNRRTA